MCRGRGERIQSSLGPGQKPPPQGMGPSHMPACPCLQPLPQDPRLQGQIRACSEGQASKSRDFTCEKLKIKRF